MNDNDKPLNGIVLDGKYYDMVKDDCNVSKCGLCDLDDDDCKRATCYYQGSDYHFRFSQLITDKINEK